MTVVASNFERKHLDLYETEAWATEALLRHFPVNGLFVWEPAAGNHAIVDVLTHHGACLWASDIETYDRTHGAVADYLADTGHLSTTEHGAYMLLIMHYWQNEGLPTEDLKLARICRLSAKEWREIRETISDLFGRKRWGSTPADAALHGRFKRSRPGLTASVRQIVFARDGGVCQYCGAACGPFEVDHVIPWSRGGQHSQENFALACRPCNRSKGTLTLEEWLQ